jgi:hypothetical protein
VQSPPEYGDMGGHVALLADTACYVLTDDDHDVLGARGLPHGSNEVVTYRDGQSCAPDSHARRSGARSG